MFDTPQIVFRATLSAALVCGTFARPSTAATDDVENAGGEQVDISQLTTQELVFKGIDELINWSRQFGDQDTAVKWQVYKLKFPVHDEIEESINVAGYLENCADDLLSHSKLREARNLLNLSREILQKLEGDTAEWLSLANLGLFCVDLASEDYENALVHLDNIDIDSIRDDDDRRLLKAGLCINKADALFGLRRYQEAEEIYVSLLQKADETSQYPTHTINVVRTKLGRLYIDTGRIAKAQQLTATVYDDLASTEGEIRALGHLRLGFEANVVKLNLALGDRQHAEKRARFSIELAQRRWGVESVEYLQSIELLAVVRVAQARHYEALDLYEKSKEVRSRIFGSDHSSVARVQAEIKLVRSQSASAPLSTVLLGISECLETNPLKVASSVSDVAPVAADTQTSIDPVSLGGGKVNLDSQGLLDLLDKPILK